MGHIKFGLESRHRRCVRDAYRERCAYGIDEPDDFGSWDGACWHLGCWLWADILRGNRVGVGLNRALPDWRRRVRQPLDGRDHGHATIERDHGILDKCRKHQRSACQQHSADGLGKRDRVWVWAGYTFADLKCPAGQKHMRAYLVAVRDINHVQIRTSHIGQSACGIVQRSESVKREQAVFSWHSGYELTTESERRCVWLHECDGVERDARSKRLQCFGKERSDCM